MSLRYPGMSMLGRRYTTAWLSLWLRKEQWVSDRHKTEEPPASLKALEVVQVGESLRKSKRGEVMSTKGDASVNL